MSDSNAALRHQMAIAVDLQSVVRTMRALAASSIHQYEQSVLALADYRQTIEHGLGACLRAAPTVPGDDSAPAPAPGGEVVMLAFGTDQGLVGQFNELLCEQLARALHPMRGPPKLLVVGERLRSRLEEAGIAVFASYALPSCVEEVSGLVDRLLLDIQTGAGPLSSSRIEVVHNRPLSGSVYEPVQLQLLPLDAAWRSRLVANAWPGSSVPQIMGKGVSTLACLIREHLFISVFQACAESLASENASRLSAMQRADQNIDDLLGRLRASYHRQRQDSIDEELFDVTAGFVAQNPPDHPAPIATPNSGS